MPTGEATTTLDAIDDIVQVPTLAPVDIPVLSNDYANTAFNLTINISANGLTSEKMPIINPPDDDYVKYFFNDVHGNGTISANTGSLAFDFNSFTRSAAGKWVGGNVNIQSSVGTLQYTGAEINVCTNFDYESDSFGMSNATITASGLYMVFGTFQGVSGNDSLAISTSGTGSANKLDQTTVISSYTNGAAGTVTQVGDILQYTYTPGAGEHDDEFTYTITDWTGAYDTATVTIDVTNEAPTVQEDLYIVVMGNSIYLHPMLNDSDPEGGELTLRKGNNDAEFGSVSFSGDQVTYTPNAGISGKTDTFSYFAVDDFGFKSEAFVTLNLHDPISVSAATDILTLEIIDGETFDNPVSATFTTVVADEEHAVAGATTKAVERANIRDEANQEWNEGLDAAENVLSGRIEAEQASVASQIVAQEATLQGQLAGNWTSYSDSVTTLRGMTQAALSENQSAYNSAVTGLTFGLTDGFGDASELAEIAAAIQAQSLEFFADANDASQAFDTNAETDGVDWATKTSAAFIEFESSQLSAYVIGVNAIDLADEVASNSTYTATTTYLGALHQAEVTAFNATELAKKTYLDLLRANKNRKEGKSEEAAEAEETALLAVYASFYQDYAEHREGTKSLADMQVSYKALKEAVLESKIRIAEKKEELALAFVTKEQRDSVARVVSTETANQAALSAEADARKAHEDSIADATFVQTNSAADAFAVKDLSVAAAQKAKATDVASFEAEYALGILGEGYIRDLSVNGDMAEMMVSQLNAVKNWYTQTGDTQSAANVANAITVAQANLSMKAADMRADRDFMTAFTNFQKSLQHNDINNAAAYTTAVIGIEKASTKAVAADLQTYQKKAAELDREWVTKSSSKDLAYIRALAKALKSWNMSSHTPDPSSAESEAGLLRRELAELQAMAPSQLSLPEYYEGNSDLNTILDSGKFNITKVEQEFAADELGPPGNFDIDPQEVAASQTPPTPSWLEAVAGYTQLSSSKIQTSNVIDKNVESDAADDVLVGYVYIDVNGEPWVKRYGQIGHDSVGHVVYETNSNGDILIGANGRPIPKTVLGGDVVAVVPVWWFVSKADVEGAMGANTTGADWTHYFQTNGYFSGPPSEFTPPNPGTGSGPPAQIDSIFDVMPSWMVSAIGGQAGDGVDQIINGVDSFSAGTADTVTGGWTTKIRANVYGTIATRNHEGGLFVAGQIVGIAPAVGVAVYSGAVGHTGSLLKTARGLELAVTARSAIIAGNNVYEGNGTWGDALALSGPAITGFSRFFKWVKCFEGSTEVAVNWELAAQEDSVAQVEENEWQTGWLVLGVTALASQPGGPLHRLYRRRNHLHFA